MILSIGEYKPDIHPTAFIHPTAEISGKVRPAAGTIFYSEPQNKRIVATIRAIKPTF